MGLYYNSASISNEMINNQQEQIKELLQERNALKEKLTDKNKTIENLQNELNFSRVEIGALEEKVLKYKTKAKKLKKKLKKIELIVKCDYLKMEKLPTCVPDGNEVKFYYEFDLSEKQLKDIQDALKYSKMTLLDVKEDKEEKHEKK